MKIGILETGEVHPDLVARHGDYPAMFERLLGAVDPGLEFATVRVVAGEMPAAPGQADARPSPTGLVVCWSSRSSG